MTTKVALLLAMLLGIVAPVYAEGTALNISQCFSPLLVTHENHSSETNWEWFYLAMMNSTDFQKSNEGIQTSALTPYGMGKGDWEKADERRKEYFKYNQQNIKYYQALASNVSALPVSWQPTIQSCIDGVLRSTSKGLSYLVINSLRPDEFRLEIKYASTEPGDASPYVESSEIRGGHFEIGGKTARVDQLEFKQ